MFMNAKCLFAKKIHYCRRNNFQSKQEVPFGGIPETSVGQVGCARPQRTPERRPCVCLLRQLEIFCLGKYREGLLSSIGSNWQVLNTQIRTFNMYYMLLDFACWQRKTFILLGIKHYSKGT